MSFNLFQILFEISDKKAEAGVCGLRNLGNTCFMSTGVQCLMATPSLVHCLLHYPTPAKDSLSLQLSQLTHKMWSGQYSTVQPTDFKESLGAHYPQFKDFRQVWFHLWFNKNKTVLQTIIAEPIVHY